MSGDGVQESQSIVVPERQPLFESRRFCGLPVIAGVQAPGPHHRELQHNQAHYSDAVLRGEPQRLQPLLALACPAAKQPIWLRRYAAPQTNPALATAAKRVDCLLHPYCRSLVETCRRAAYVRVADALVRTPPQALCSRRVSVVRRWSVAWVRASHQRR